ncbi:potassium channel family protein [Roseitalea porphyridii]|uniref:Two pore domain potassium channel family protein n=1 Tax=Roseitalea porphyridii TaxID=1852022 RepID=A0A4P6UY71_9HYPH|nr:potassium channel family protein [Roseitalea porphyridii]QBK29299.1 two pore domain potassium channel family protein [Roseitalea porphyridii]
MPPVRIAVLVVALVVIIAGGTAFFRLVEGWSWLDSYFYAVVTLSTVGYGNLVPETPLGKIGTTAFIFIGLGVFAAAIQQIAEFTITGRDARRRRQRALAAERRREDTDTTADG